MLDRDLLKAHGIVPSGAQNGWKPTILESSTGCGRTNGQEKSQEQGHGKGPASPWLPKGLNHAQDPSSPPLFLPDGG
jgi:hypothetical protein